MKQKDLPTKKLIQLDIADIKNKLLYSDSWDRIEEIRDYCDELLELNDDEDLQPKTKNQIINNLIHILENLKE